MNKPLIWKTAVILVVLIACAVSVYPPGGRSFLYVFEKTARDKDEEFGHLLASARAELEGTSKDPGIVVRDLAERTDVDLTQYFDGEDNRQVIALLHQKAAPKIRLGLDLRGGTEFVLRVKTEELADYDARRDAPDRALEIIRNRVDQYGLAEPEIYREGTDRIIVKLPGVSELEKEAIRDLLMRAAYLEFRMVHESNDWVVAQMTDPDFVPPAGYEKLRLDDERDGKKYEEDLWVAIKPELTGQYLRTAGIEYQTFGTPIVQLSFNAKGAKLFAGTTRRYAPGGTLNPDPNTYRRLAIVLDGKLYSAPRIDEEISGGEAVIRGQFSMKEATALSIVLRSGALPAPIEVLEERGVDPSLGRESVRSGLIAGLSGMALVMIFVLVYYQLSGIVANIALLMNVVLIFGVLALFRPNLTLPGIAGIILTIGMAVDANVLIYERIREEQAAAKRLRSAISAGYQKVFSTIFDANITTLLTAVILGYFGSGPVRGFAVTLSVGILASMFTALVGTRVAFEWMIELNLLRRLRMLGILRNPAFDFMGKWKIAVIASLALIVVGMGVFAARGEKNLGIDFTGGAAVTLRCDTAVPVSDMRRTLGDAGLSRFQIQYKHSPDTGHRLVEVRTPDRDRAEQAEQALAKAYPEAGFARLQIDIVGAAVGSELRRKALWAMALSLVGIMIYISWRFEFAFAVGAIAALAHDVVITLGAIAITGRYLSLPMLAAVLTIIGYSLNDTIVIFDRIREDVAIAGKRRSYIDVMNRAINETLSRTIITSLTTLIVVLTLWLFGGGVINDFAFALLVGIIAGTYSTIYIASPVALMMHREKK